jgi:Ca-activated chloride channel homolog
MKLKYYMFLILLNCFTVFGQDWRDSLNQARVAYRMKNFEKAIRLYESAQKKAPKGVDFSDEIGQSAYKAKEYEKAEKVYRKSSSLKKDKNSKARTFHNIGNSKMQLKDYKGAIDAYKKSLKNNSINERTRYNLSEAIRRLKKQENRKEPKDNPDSKPNKPKDSKNPKEKKDDQKDMKSEPKRNDRNQDQGQRSKLSDNRVEKILDKLMKEESATKRKISKTKGDNSKSNSGNDW